MTLPLPKVPPDHPKHADLILARETLASLRGELAPLYDARARLSVSSTRALIEPLGTLLVDLSKQDARLTLRAGLHLQANDLPDLIKRIEAAGAEPFDVGTARLSDIRVLEQRFDNTLREFTTALETSP